MAKILNKFTGFEDMAMRIKPAEKPTHKRPRHQAPEHLKFIRGLPCLVCWRTGGVDAAHIRFPWPTLGKRPTGKGEKPSDEWTVPLCRGCHSEQHRGNEQEFWFMHFEPDDESPIDVLIIALALWAASGDQERGEQIIRSSVLIPIRRNR